MRQIIKILITRSILELGPTILHGNLSSYPVLPENIILGYFIFLGYLTGQTYKNWKDVYKITGPESRSVIFYARDPKEHIFHRCPCHLGGTVKHGHSIWLRFCYDDVDLLEKFGTLF